MRKNTDIIILIFCIIITIGLSIAIIINGKDLSCEKCEIDYRQTQMSGAQINKVYKVNLLELYEEFRKGDCLLTWDRVQGFYYYG